MWGTAGRVTRAPGRLREHRGRVMTTTFPAITRLGGGLRRSLLSTLKKHYCGGSCGGALRRFCGGAAVICNPLKTLLRWFAAVQRKPVGGEGDYKFPLPPNTGCRPGAVMSEPRLVRTAFKTSRLLDFVGKRELVARPGMKSKTGRS